MARLRILVDIEGHTGVCAACGKTLPLNGAVAAFDGDVFQAYYDRACARRQWGNLAFTRAALWRGMMHVLGSMLLLGNVTWDEFSSPRARRRRREAEMRAYENGTPADIIDRGYFVRGAVGF